MIKKDTKSWTFTCIYEKCKNAYVKRVGFLFQNRMQISFKFKFKQSFKK